MSQNGSIHSSDGKNDSIGKYNIVDGKKEETNTLRISPTSSKIEEETGLSGDKPSIKVKVDMNVVSESKQQQNIGVYRQYANTSIIKKLKPLIYNESNSNNTINNTNVNNITPISNIVQAKTPDNKLLYVKLLPKDTKICTMSTNTSTNASPQISKNSTFPQTLAQTTINYHIHKSQSEAKTYPLNCSTPPILMDTTEIPQPQNEPIDSVNKKNDESPEIDSKTESIVVIEDSPSTGKISREVKQLKKMMNESKILSEYINETENSKQRKSRKSKHQQQPDEDDNSVRSLSPNHTKLQSRDSVTPTDLSETSDQRAKRNMRSQNIEFVQKHQKFLSRIQSQQDSDDVYNSDEETNDSSFSRNSEHKGKSKVAVVDIPPPPKPGWDKFCWRCHHDGPAIGCLKCVRSFHLKCAKLQQIRDDWICHECLVIENAEKSNSGFHAKDSKDLNEMLSFALKRMQQIKGTSDLSVSSIRVTFSNYDDYIVNPIDLETLQYNIDSLKYKSAEGFLADAQWILHNVMIFFSDIPKLTTLAKFIFKICKQEVYEIEICYECYCNANTKKDWFTEVCSKPHLLLWAKLKSFPYWPAKAMVVNSQGLVSVRFFGDHDRAWVPVKDCFLYSDMNPNTVTKIKRNNIVESVKEVDLHISKIVKKFGLFRHAPLRTPFDPVKANEQLACMIPSFSKSDKGDFKIVIDTPNSKSKLTYKITKSADNHLSISPVSSDANSSTTTPEKNVSQTEKSPELHSNKITIERKKYEGQRTYQVLRRKSTIDGSTTEKIPKRKIEDDKLEKVIIKRKSDNWNMITIPKKRKISNDRKSISKDKAIAAETSLDNISDNNSETKTVTASTNIEIESPALSFPNLKEKRKITLDDEVNNSPQSAKRPSLKMNDENNPDKPSELDDLNEKNLNVITPAVTRHAKIIADKKSEYLEKLDLQTNTNVARVPLTRKSVHDKINRNNDKAKDNIVSQSKGNDINEKNEVDINIEKLNVIPNVEVEDNVEMKKNQNVDNELDRSNSPQKNLASDKLSSTASSSNEIYINEPMTIIPIEDIKVEPGAPATSNSSVSVIFTSNVADPLCLSKMSKNRDLDDIEIKSEPVSDDDNNEEMIIDSNIKSLNPIQFVHPKGFVTVRDINKMKNLPIKKQVSMPLAINPVVKKVTTKAISPPIINHKYECRNLSKSKVIPPMKTQQRARKSFPVSKSKQVPSTIVTPLLNGNNNNISTTIPITRPTSFNIYPNIKNSNNMVYIPMDSSINRSDFMRTTSSMPLPPLVSVSGNPLIISSVSSQASIPTSMSLSSISTQPQITTSASEIVNIPANSNTTSSTTICASTVACNSTTNVVVTVSTATPTITTESHIMSGVVSHNFAAAITDSIVRSPPKLTARPTGPLRSDGDAVYISEYGPISRKIAEFSHTMADYFKGVLEDSIKDLGNAGCLEAKCKFLELEMEKIKFSNLQEVNELKQNSDRILCEMKSSMETEKARIIIETKKQCELERLRAVEETKKKQWCVNCSKEAQFYCCWNTSYCDYQCQQQHWPKHMTSCAQNESANHINAQKSASNSMVVKINKVPKTKETPASRCVNSTVRAPTPSRNNVNNVPLQRLVPISTAGSPCYTIINTRPVQWEMVPGSNRLINQNTIQSANIIVSGATGTCGGTGITSSGQIMEPLVLASDSFVISSQPNIIPGKCNNLNSFNQNKN